MSSNHHGKVPQLTLGDIFIRHREVMRELLEKHHCGSIRIYPTNIHGGALASHAPCKRGDSAQATHFHISTTDLFFRPREDRSFDDSLPASDTESESFFDCLSDEEDILGIGSKSSRSWQEEGHELSLQSASILTPLVENNTERGPEFSAMHDTVLPKQDHHPNPVEVGDDNSRATPISKTTRNEYGDHLEIVQSNRDSCSDEQFGTQHQSDRREGKESNVLGEGLAVSRNEQEDQETPSEPLSPPQPIRETTVALSEKFNSCINMWTEISHPSKSSDDFNGDEDPRPGLSPLTIFSDDITDFGPQDHDIRAQHYIVHGIEALHSAKASSARLKRQLEHSPHLIPSPRSVTSMQSSMTFKQPVLRTTERARSQDRCLLHNCPSSPHRIPSSSTPHRIHSTASRSSKSEPAEHIPASITPALSPPRTKSRVKRRTKGTLRNFY